MTNTQLTSIGKNYNCKKFYNSSFRCKCSNTLKRLSISFFIFKNFSKNNFFFSKILNFVAPDSFLKMTAATHDVIKTIVSHAAVATLFISASIVHSSYFACSCPFHKASLPCDLSVRWNVFCKLPEKIFLAWENNY